MDIQLLNGLLLNIAFVFYMCGFIIRQKECLLRINLLFANTFLILWAVLCLDLQQSYSIPLWNALFFLINLSRLYKGLANIKKDRINHIYKHEILFFYQDFLNFFTLGNWYKNVHSQHRYNLKVNNNNISTKFFNMTNNDDDNNEVVHHIKETNIQETNIQETNIPDRNTPDRNTPEVDEHRDR